MRISVLFFLAHLLISPKLVSLSHIRVRSLFESEKIRHSIPTTSSRSCRRQLKHLKPPSLQSLSRPKHPNTNRIQFADLTRVPLRGGISWAVPIMERESQLLHRDQLYLRRDCRRRLGFHFQRQGCRADRHLDTEDQPDPQRVGSFRQVSMLILYCGFTILLIFVLILYYNVANLQSK
ncbi:mitochondrial import inner membrane translocase subunit tim23-1 [Phtheirospermum japonicum]|uniref:Mitochondrial import inner membrane translocase subunit tim23-1 n=1 Tax=Phtheirospermum japonicum TaxID=374723 RepID=A0A830DER6_9LAMI|nr:mitochondrial import inner membrane translocase subunit tim23-1 [Phtheirospermum japonicum]